MDHEMESIDHARGGLSSHQGFERKWEGFEEV